MGNGRDEDSTRNSRPVVYLDLDDEVGDDGPRKNVTATLLRDFILRENPSYISNGVISEEV